MAPILRERAGPLTNITKHHNHKVNRIPPPVNATKTLSETATGLSQPGQDDKENFRPSLADRVKQRRRTSAQADQPLLQKQAMPSRRAKAPPVKTTLLTSEVMDNPSPVPDPPTRTKRKRSVDQVNPPNLKLARAHSDLRAAADSHPVDTVMADAPESMPEASDMQNSSPLPRRRTTITPLTEEMVQSVVERVTARRDSRQDSPMESSVRQTPIMNAADDATLGGQPSRLGREFEFSPFDYIQYQREALTQLAQSRNPLYLPGPGALSPYTATPIVPNPLEAQPTLLGGHAHPATNIRRDISPTLEGAEDLAAESGMQSPGDDLMEGNETAAPMTEESDLVLDASVADDASPGNNGTFRSSPLEAPNNVTHLQDELATQAFDTADESDAASTIKASQTRRGGLLVKLPVKVPKEVDQFEGLSNDDRQFMIAMLAACKAHSNVKAGTIRRQQGKRILGLLKIAKPASATEGLVLSSEEAQQQLDTNTFFSGPIFVQGAQPMKLSTIPEFLGEYYDESVKVFVQDPLMKTAPCVKDVTIKQLKHRFEQTTKHTYPWNCLELAAHFEDGLRPAFLNNEDCRLLTKLKVPAAGDQVSCRGFEVGWKEIEKWALLAQAGSLTEPHQDSHAYSTYITVQQGIMGFGWLSNPTAAQHKAWLKEPYAFTNGSWRYRLVRAGETVYFPNGTVHFVFRLYSAGDTLAFGGHVLRCSQIVSWVKTLLEEKAHPGITNEEITVSAPAYLERVAAFVKQARRMGQEAKWGGGLAIQEFLRLKDEFMATPPPKR